MARHNISEEAKKWRAENPDWEEEITKTSKERSTGPRTELGKLKASLNSVKDLSQSTFFIKYLGCNNHPKKAVKGCEQCEHMKKVFIQTLKSGGKEGFEKFALLKLISRLEADLSTEGKLNKRIEIEKAKLLKNALIGLHYMVYGTKSEVTVKKSSIDDLRKAVFEVKDVRETEEKDGVYQERDNNSDNS